MGCSLATSAPRARGDAAGRLGTRERVDLRILNRHIGVSVGRGLFLVMLVLSALFSFLVLVDQLDDVGDGRFGVLDALLYMAFTLPRRILDLAPATALLGSLLALGGLARGSELIVMRGAGVSVAQVGWAVLRFGLVVAIAIPVFDQWVASPLAQRAHSGRLAALSGTDALVTSHGFWSRDGQRFVNVREVRHGRIPAAVDVYEFDGAGRLARFVHAATGELRADGQWELRDVHDKNFRHGRIVSERHPLLQAESFLTEKQLELLTAPAASLTLTDLFRYVRYLRSSDQRANRYELAMWQKIVLPVITVAMMLLALPFFFGSLRGTSAGERMLLGGVLGVGLYLSQEIIANLGLLMNLNAPLTAAIPLVVVLVLFGLAVRRNL